MSLLTGCGLFSDSSNDNLVDSQATVQNDEETQVEEVQETSKGKKKNKNKNEQPSRVLKTEADIRADLDRVAKKLVSQAARTVVPKKSAKEVKKIGNEYIATYIEVDPNAVSTEMNPADKGKYVGFIRYEEKIYECKGSTKAAALKAECLQARSRRLTEMIYFNGKAWHY